MYDGPTIELACEFKAETENAILIYDPASEEQMWIPLSQVSQINRDPKTKHGTIVISEWIAKQKGLL